MMEAPVSDRQAIRAHLITCEPSDIVRLTDDAALSIGDRRAIAATAAGTVKAIRTSGEAGMMEQFLAEYGLSTKEGIALMCLAEALLRVPDDETIDELIEDKIVPADWGLHLGKSTSSLVNASTWALLLTGRILDDDDAGLAGSLRGALKRLGEPVIRRAVAQAMRELGRQFVMAETIEGAIKEAHKKEGSGYTYSYDMLGEAARTDADAKRYHLAYVDAITKLGLAAKHNDIARNPGISVKLSALHPRYEVAQHARVMRQLVPRLRTLAELAVSAGIGFNIDAEETDRLDLSLDVIEALMAHDSLEGWNGLGVVVQTYGPRAPFVIDWLNDFAIRQDRRVMVRLVKGAYWDTEVKRAQIMGLEGFPVFTRKALTDISYLACARRLLRYRQTLYPQFATHNAHTTMAILHMAGQEGADPTVDFEFQRLHGMGVALHEQLVVEHKTRCRIYAPVGAHRDLLAYLVRRLLENGANSSFVSQIANPKVAPETVAADPFSAIEAEQQAAHHSAIAVPARLFGERLNSAGLDLSDPLTLTKIDEGRAPFEKHIWQAESHSTTPAITIHNPAKPDELVGHAQQVDGKAVTAAFEAAANASWPAKSVDDRALCLERAADLYEAHAFELFALLAREAGKSLPDAVSELREAVDFLRYYARESRTLVKTRLGEPLGTFVCISPWNFPLAIFTGQIAAALAMGNTVLAKPAEQTPLVAIKAVALLHKAGIPTDALILLPGDGPVVGASLVADPRLGGVCFTGSTATAQLIHKQLSKTAPAAPLIAETGGLNAMIVDSSALLEQAVRDIVASAFQSAGQRCSALRILYVQDDVAQSLKEMLFGAMDALVVGDPWSLTCDVGPLIDQSAKAAIGAYVDKAKAQGRCLKQLTVPAIGHFLAPTVLSVDGIEAMDEEIFGPVLHLATFKSQNIDAVVTAINGRGYGLTMGVHSRIDSRVQDVIGHAHVGNLYVNRNQIGAVVGSQPFGGEGLSGTGFKAGGPHYLKRFYGRSEPVEETIYQQSTRAIDAKSLQAVCQKLRKAKAATPKIVEGLATSWMGSSTVAKAWQLAMTVETGPIDLPGTTGESNRLRLHPRGLVLCMGPGPDLAKAQALQSLYAGNPTLIISSVPIAIPAGLTPLIVLEGHIEPDLLRDIEGLTLIALADPTATAPIRRALAARVGPIVGIQQTLTCPEAFYVERTISIDTTAAGGNASLLAAVS